MTSSAEKLLSAQASSTETEFAYYPLTLCDSLQQSVQMAKAWVVEGVVDVEKIREALDRVVAKWPMLAGRVEKTGRERFRIRIPLGTLPVSYKPYNLSVTDSEIPLSHYTPLPIPAFSDVLPRHLFLSPEPARLQLRNLTAYASNPDDAPLTHWHITHFRQKGAEYSCIGMLYSHGVFDGIGSAFLVHALAAELSGKEWDVPLPEVNSHPGVHENMFWKLLEAEGETEEERPLDSYPSSSLGGLWTLLAYFLWSLWTIWVVGVGHYSVVIPYRVHRKLVEEVREEVKGAEGRVGTGDVFFAWALKALYSNDPSPHKTIAPHCTQTLRTEWSPHLSLYPHNCNIAQSLPALSLSELTTTPLSHLALRLSQARTRTPRIVDARRHLKLWKQADAMQAGGHLIPHGGVADESVIMSNVSFARVADVDWSGADGGKVVANYVISVTDLGMIPGLVTLNGRLGNGDLVLNFCVAKRRSERLGKAAERLIEAYA